MKKLLVLIMLFTFIGQLYADELYAQETKSEEKKESSTDKEEEDDEETTRINVGGVEVIIKEKNDKERTIILDGKEIEDLEKMGEELEEMGEKLERELGEDDDEHDDDDDDNSAKKRKGYDPVKTRWFMLDVGLNTYLEDGSADITNTNLALNQGKSWNVDFHIFKQRIGLIKNYVNLMYGLSVDYNHYNFNSDAIMVDGVDDLQFITPEGNLVKNKIRTTFVNVPLMLHVNTNPRKPGRAIKLSGGVYGGILTKVKAKRIYDDSNKNIVKDDFNINRFRFGFVGQLGIGPINLYAKYSPDHLFRDSLGGGLQPVSVGLSVIPF